MKKKLVGVLLTAAMAVSALAGCGSKQAAAPAESKAAEEKTETVQEATEEAEAAEGEEVLTVWCGDRLRFDVAGDSGVVGSLYRYGVYAESREQGVLCRYQVAGRDSVGAYRFGCR